VLDELSKQAVEQCSGDDRKFREASVGGRDHRAPLVARVDELEEQIATALDDRQVVNGPRNLPGLGRNFPHWRDGD
jgi:hypothetical protein